MRLKRCTLHERRQTQFHMSSLNSLNLAGVGELALSAMVKLYQKQMVVPLSAERLSAASSVEPVQLLLVLGSWGQGQEEDGAGEKWVLTFPDKLYPECSFQLQLSSVCVCTCVCTHCTSLFMFVCACATVCAIRVYVCVAVDVGAFPVGKSASRILAQGFLPIRTWRREQMELSEVYSQLRVPCLSPTTTHPHTHTPPPPTNTPLYSPHAPQPAVRGFCNFIKATGHSFMVEPQTMIPWEVVSWSHVQLTQYAI